MKTLLAILFLFPAAAMAQGDHSGGGGDVVYCSTPIEQHGLLKKLFGRKSQTNYYLLDVYEAWKTENRRLDLGGPNLSIYEKIELVRQDFARLDPVRANAYADEAVKIAQDLDANEHGKTEKDKTVWGLATVLDQRLTDIPDADDQYKFPECKKEQLVRQEKPTEVTLGAAFYQFDKKYWRKLDRDNKVATLFHEAIYKEFRQYGASVSRPSRALNSYLFSRTSAQLSLPRYLGFLASNGAKDYYFQSNIGKVRLYNFYADRWSANVGFDGWITDVHAGYARVNLGEIDFRYTRLPLAKVTHYSFNRARELTALNGVFSIAYNRNSKRIVDYNANCLSTALDCLTGTTISVEPGGKFRFGNGVDSILFDLDGKIE